MEFLNFADVQGLAFGADDGVDTGLVACFNEEVRKGRGATHGEKTLAALLRRAPESGKLGARRVPRAWRALRGWRGLGPARSRPPHLRRARAAVSNGCVLRDRPRLDPRFAMAPASFLRPGAMFAVREEGLMAPVVGISG